MRQKKVKPGQIMVVVLAAIQSALCAVMEMTECEAWPAPAWEGRQGVEAALVCRGTTVPLSPTGSTCPQWLGANNADHFLLKTQTSA